MRRVAAWPHCLLLVLALWPCWTRAAAPPATHEGILQQELKQQQLQRTTRRVAEQLAWIVTEYENNGMSGDDLRTLKAIQAMLGRLSQKDMEQVVILLTQARAAADPTDSKQRLAGAYAGQQTIITLLKQLLLEYERQQALYELSIRFREMAARQGKNMRAGLWLTKNNPSGQFNEEQRLALQVQQMDQGQLREETALLIGRLDKLVAETEGTTTGERPKAAAQRVREGGLLAAMDAAVADLKSKKTLDLGPVKELSASGHEKRARDELREIARLLLLSKDPRDLLRVAIAETEAALILQKQVIEETLKVEKRDDALLVEDHQAEVVDAADLVRRDVQDIAPAATGYLRAADDRMQEARTIFKSWDGPDKKRREAPPLQREAVTNLELAKRALQDQLAKAEAEAEKPEDKLDQLRELLKDVQELTRKQEALKEETALAEKKPQDLRAKAPEQGDLKDQTQDAQQQAADPAPAAAQALGRAASEMDFAQKNLAKSQSASESQQAAVEALKEAGRELVREIARLEEAEKQLAALDKLSEKVGQLIQEQEQVNLDTAKEAVKPTPLASVARDLAQKEKDLAKESGAAQQEAAQAAPAAAPHLGEAKSRMNEASDQLGKRDARMAQAPERKAISELFAAKEEIDRQMGDLKEQLGQHDLNAPPSLAQAAAAIAKAQAEVNQAMTHMANAPPGLLESLVKQQQQIAAALGQKNRETPSPQASQAQQVASKAAGQLSQGELPQAINSMQQAQERIQAAQTGEPASQEQNTTPQGQQRQTGEQGPPSFAELGRQQARVREQAEALLAAQQAVPASAMDAAAAELTEAAHDVTPVAAGEMGPLPPSAEAAVQAALNSLNSAAGQAAGRQQAPARANAAAAAQALAQAQAALALADSGLSSDLAQSGAANQPGQGQQPGPGKQPGRGQQPGQQPSPGMPSPQGTGRVGNWNGPGGANGPLRTTPGSGQFVRLPGRDRAAIQQSRSENYPQEYGPQVEQYLKNLSDQTSPK